MKNLISINNPIKVSKIITIKVGICLTHINQIKDIRFIDLIKYTIELYLVNYMRPNSKNKNHKWFLSIINCKWRKK